MMDEADRTSTGIGTKRCPRCGEELFEDMDVCYGCLYDFTREQRTDGTSPTPLPTPADSTLVCEDPWCLEPLTLVSGEEEEGLQPQPVAVRPRGQEGPCLSVRIRSESMEVTLPLPADGLLVGRGNVCDVILHARAVSRHHVRIIPRDGRALVEDCGSTNRARLRGQEVEAVMTMEVGDVLNVCGTLFFLLDGRAM